jgi:hypothetical protein
MPFTFPTIFYYLVFSVNREYLSTLMLVYAEVI